MDVKLYKSFSNELRKNWDNIKKENKAFFDFDWLKHWHITIGKKENIHPNIIVFKNSNITEAIFPFGIINFKGIVLVRFLGGDQNDYNYPLTTSNFRKIKKKNFLFNAINNYLPKYDLLLLEKIPKESLDFPVYEDFKSYISNAENTFQLILPNEVDKLKHIIKKKTFFDTRRQTKRLSEIGNLKFSIVDIDNDYEKKLFFKSLFSFKSASYRSMGVNDMFSKTHYKNFYQNIQLRSNNHLYLHMSILTLDNEIIALHWGIVQKNLFYFMLPTYSKKWSKYSPGKVFLKKLIEWSIKNKIKIFDFTVGAEDYKFNWTNSKSCIVKLSYSRSLRGKLMLLLIGFKEKIKLNKYFSNIVRKLRNY